MKALKEFQLFSALDSYRSKISVEPEKIQMNRTFTKKNSAFILENVCVHLLFCLENENNTLHFELALAINRILKQENLILLIKYVLFNVDPIDLNIFLGNMYAFGIQSQPTQTVWINFNLKQIGRSSLQQK